LTKLLIVNLSQFGYHTDTYYYCKYLKDEFKITYLCWDYNKPQILMENVNIVYVSRKGNKYLRYFSMLRKFRKYVKNNEDNIIFIKYFRLCSCLTFGNSGRNIVLDIRTGAVSTSLNKRLFYNFCFSVDRKFYNKFTVISESLREALNIPKKNSHVLPLGSQVFSNSDKEFDKLNLLYVGTLSQRRIEDTITGIREFLDRHKIRVEYNIIGDGPPKDLGKVLNTIQKTGLKDVVHYRGRITHENIGYFFDVSNIGVVYIPLTKQYDRQPPTKLFECLLSGIPVIATETYENKRIVNNNNGILIKDNSGSFAEGLETIWNNRGLYNSKKIREEVSEYTWENIVMNNLKPYFKFIS